MRNFFKGFVAYTLLFGNAFSQDCSKLRPNDIQYLNSVSFIENFSCSDVDIEIIVAQSSVEVLPFSVISVKKKDFNKFVTTKNNILKINGVKYQASQVAIYEPPCVYEKLGGKGVIGGGFSPLSCNNPLVSYRINREKYFAEAFKEYEKINSSSYRKAVEPCKDKLKSYIVHKIEEYVSRNGGKILSIVEKRDLSQQAESDGKVLDWKKYEIEISNDQKKIVLTLLYPFLDSSDLHFTSPSHDSFGEVVPHSERSGRVRVNIAPMPAREFWIDAQFGVDVKFNGNTAALLNMKTKQKVLEINFNQFSCSEEVVFNPNQTGDNVYNSLVRDNKKQNMNIENTHRRNSQRGQLQ